MKIDQADLDYLSNEMKLDKLDSRELLYAYDGDLDKAIEAYFNL